MPGTVRKAPVLGPAIAFLLALASPAGALTLDARAVAPGPRPGGSAPAAAASARGRVAEARSFRDADGVLRTHVVLVDEAGRETARFSVPGGVEGGVRWVVEGVPAFAPGQEVSVRLAPAPAGPTVLSEDDVRFEPAAGQAGAVAPLAPTATPVAPTATAASTVTTLDPTLGGAVPADGPVVSVRGAGFGAAQLDSRVTFQGLFDRVDAPVISWSDTQVVCRVPAPGLWGDPQVFTGPIKIWTAAGGWSDGDPFVGGPRFNVLWQWAGDSWPIARLPLGLWVNPGDGPYGDSLAAICADAAAQWNVPGSYAHFVYRGLTDAWAGNHGDPATPRDGRNTVAWRSAWPYPSAWLAVTWSAIDTLTYERLEVDLEINGTRPWTLDPENEPTSFDLPSTLAHEFGHWLRLGHVQQVASVMTAFIEPGVRRRQISVGDSWGASWIHPSYGTVSAPDSIPSGAPLGVTLAVFDRQGLPRAGVPASRITLRAVPLSAAADAGAASTAAAGASTAIAGASTAAAGASTAAATALPGPLDPPVPASEAFTAMPGGPTGAEGRAFATFGPLPDGIYRIEATADGRFIRPSPLVRVGAAPVAPAPVLSLLAARPSPLRPGDHGTVRFSLPAPAQARLALYDVRGRLVRVLAAGRLAAGAQDAPLEATGADGRTLAGGVYFVRLSATDAASGRPLPARTARVVYLP